MNLETLIQEQMRELAELTAKLAELTPELLYDTGGILVPFEKPWQVTLPAPWPVMYACGFGHCHDTEAEAQDCIDAGWPTPEIVER